MRKVERETLPAFLAAADALCPVYWPVDEEGGARFARWTAGTAMSTAVNTNQSAKDFFFPHTEPLATFRCRGKQVEVVDDRPESEPFVLFGVRPCDARSFELLDAVFLSEPADAGYASRREQGIVVSLACNCPAETCFCSVFDIDAAAPGGDVAAWLTEDELILSSQTPKGEAWLSSLEAVTQPAPEEAPQPLQAAIRETVARLPLADLSLAPFGRESLTRRFSSPLWESLSQTCLGCGTCTFLCPTCQCYDIRDFDTGEGIQRFRCWDSCMYADFTQMAAENPRQTQRERFRQRFMHKLVYYPAEHDGAFSCVGCGRCVAKCPRSLHIARVIRAFKGEE